jgi:hypothetical protein
MPDMVHLSMRNIRIYIILIHLDIIILLGTLEKGLTLLFMAKYYTQNIKELLGG